MKKIYLCIICFVMFFMISTSADCATITDFKNTNSVKIAFIDMQSVLKNSKQYNAIVEERQMNLTNLTKFVEAAKKEIIKQSTSEKQRALEEQYNKELLNRKNKLDKNFNAKILELDNKIRSAISTLAKENGYDYVLMQNSVLYGGIDITENVKKMVE